MSQHDQADDRATAIQKICSYLGRIAASKQGSEELLIKGRQVYEQAARQRIKGAKEMAAFYATLHSLSRYPLGTPPTTDIGSLPSSIQKIAQTIQDAFAPPRVQKGQTDLHEPLIALDRADKTLTEIPVPEVSLLRWLIARRREEIHRLQKQPKPANIHLLLSPTLELDTIEEKALDRHETNDNEKTDDENKERRRWWKTDLPLAFLNTGPGPAFGITANYRLTTPKDNEIDAPTQVDTGEVARRIIQLEYSSPGKLTVSWEYIDPKTRRIGDEEKRLAPEPRGADTLSENPYQYNSPIPTPDWKKLAKERDVQLHDLIEMAKSQRGGLVSIVGLRRTGKTTLLRQFDARLDEIRKRTRTLLPVRMDVSEWQQTWETQGGWGPDELLQKIAESVRSKRSEQEGTLEDHALALRRSNQSLILLFDEADSLTSVEGFRGVFRDKFLRLIDRAKVLIVFAHEQSNPKWEEIWGELPKRDIHQVHSTPFLSRQATLELATRPSKLAYTALAEEYLWRVTGGYPALIHTICYHLVEKAKQAKTAIVSVKDIKETVQQILNSGDDLRYGDCLRYGLEPDETRLLIQLCENGGIDPKTGQITALSAGSNQELQITADFKLRHPGEWEDKTTQQALDGLRQKKIIDFFDRDDPATEIAIPRLRVGMLYYLAHTDRCKYLCHKKCILAEPLQNDPESWKPWIGPHRHWLCSLPAAQKQEDKETRDAHAIIQEVEQKHGDELKRQARNLYERLRKDYQTALRALCRKGSSALSEEQKKVLLDLGLAYEDDETKNTHPIKIMKEFLLSTFPKQTKPAPDPGDHGPHPALPPAHNPDPLAPSGPSEPPPGGENMDYQRGFRVLKKCLPQEEQATLATLEAKLDEIKRREQVIGSSESIWQEWSATIHSLNELAWGHCQKTFIDLCKDPSN